MMEKLFYKAIHRDGFATWLTKLDEVEDDEAKRLLGWAAAHGVTDKGARATLAYLGQQFLHAPQTPPLSRIFSGRAGVAEERRRR